MKNPQKSLFKRNRLLLIFGFAFFINPVPMGLDILPDAFGCILIFFGLTQLAYFDATIENAKKSMLYLLAVEAIKLLMMESVVTATISSNRMLAVVSGAIIEAILYIVFFRQFFGGVTYFAMRNNCNKVLKSVDGCAFLFYLSFFVRLAASVIPELMAIIELEKEVVTDFSEIEAIDELLGAKPILVALLSLIALVTAISWFISICNLINLLNAEAGEIIDNRYNTEFTTCEGAVRKKTLKGGSWIIYAALFFAIDLTFDNIRIIPAAAMFLLLAIGGSTLNKVAPFTKTVKCSIIAFTVYLCAEIFRALYIPESAIVIYEPKLLTIAIATLLALSTAVACLASVRSFLLELKSLSTALGGSEISVSFAWASYCILIILWALGYSNPFFFPYIATIRFITACVFIYQTAKILVLINDEEATRASLAGN